MALGIPGQGFLGNFLRKAILGEPIRVFGDGSQVRDPIFVDDVVHAFLLAGAAQNPKSRLWNLGGATALTVGGIAEMASAAAGSPAPVDQPFPGGSQAHRHRQLSQRFPQNSGGTRMAAAC